jgi:hypothetical protein
MNAVNFFAEVLLALFLSVVTAYFWLVRAKVAGTWQMSEDEIALKQTFQEISGALRSGGNATPIANGRLEGNQITFTAGDTKYIGRVSGNTMEGTVSSGGSWKAIRASN